MTDLTTWLLEQITQDETLARLASGWTYHECDCEEHRHQTGPGDGRWYADQYEQVVSSRRPSDNIAGCKYDDYEHNRMDVEHQAHIVMWDPARALAECEAKRQIIDLAQAQLRAAELYPGENWTGSNARALGLLQLLALPYADRPGYREEWTP